MIDVKNLHKYFGSLEVLKGIDCHIDKGECVCVIGPSGSGKSTFLRCLNLLETPTKGDIVIDDMHLTEKNFDVDAMRKRVGMVFQHFNLFPHLTILENVTLAPIRHKMMTEEQAKEKAIEMLKLTGIPNPENCFKQYPYELSGGMQQRVMIAMALSCEPKLLIADEPTTALDVTIQEQILQLIRELNEKLGMSVLFITHDMGAVANLCHNVKVMYLGQVVEEASTEELFQNPLHPYTQGLLSCIPHLGVKKGEPLPVIEGSVPPLSKVPVGCHFCTRCKMADQHCMEHEPPACEVAPGHVVKCWKYAESGKQEV